MGMMHISTPTLMQLINALDYPPTWKRFYVMHMREILMTSCMIIIKNLVMGDWVSPMLTNYENKEYKYKNTK